MGNGKIEKFLCTACAFEIGKGIKTVEVKSTETHKDKCESCGRKTYGNFYLLSWGTNS